MEPGYSGQGLVIFGLSESLVRRFETSEALPDLEEAIALSRQVIHLARQGAGSVPRSVALTKLAQALELLFRWTGDNDRLDEFVDTAKEAVEATAALDDPFRPYAMQSYGKALMARYEQLGHPTDLDLATSLLEEAAAVMSRVIPDARAQAAGDIGIILRHRFEKTGKISDLNLAIQKIAWAAKKARSGSDLQTKMHVLLGTLFGIRYHHIQALEDLNQAIKSNKAVVDSGSISGMELASCLSHLASSYSNRFIRLRSKAKDDIDSAIKFVQRAISETPHGHPAGIKFIRQLGEHLGQRSLLEPGGCEDDDLDKSIEHLDHYLSIAPAHDTERLGASITLSKGLRRRFARERNPKDINRSVELLKGASTRVDRNHTLRSDLFLAFGSALEDRSHHAMVSNPQDRGDAVNALSECLDSPGGLPVLRIAGADIGAQILESMGRWGETVHLLRSALEILPSISPRVLRQSDQQNVLKSISGLASRAAAATLNAQCEPTEVLRLLELGRDIMASMALEPRIDTALLDPSTAQRFRETQVRLENSKAPIEPPTETISQRWIEQSQHGYDAEQELQETIASIRSNSITENFANVPTLGDVLDVISEDTVAVLNESHNGCDAFLLDKVHRIRVVPLNTLRQPDIKTWAKRLKCERSLINPRMLEWLWKTVADPVLEALGYAYQPVRSRLPRIWWITAGWLSHLPIHAAGIHNSRPTTVLGRAVSVYSASLRSFVFSRSQGSWTLGDPSHHNALLVSMDKTPGLKNLPFAAEEVTRLKEVFPNIGLRAVQADPLERERVLQMLAQCSIFHFAGHGYTDPDDPSQSGLMLQDGLLRVADLQDSGLKLVGPFLGFLSACFTGTNDTEELVDEGIHLISACQLAGFRNAIGTLWQVSDKTCVDVAEKVYKAIARDGLTDDSIYLGLHDAIVDLRDAWAAQNFPSVAQNLPRHGEGEARARTPESPSCASRKRRRRRL
ncbi:uncharacterized protein PG986_012480 [Apiospora aurea]|uniref:CHAT domain-containing protein n=1 Tax=Apiospora aurea TaxID=335848 RepID=A0ABR1Q040_9PEZI